MSSVQHPSRVHVNDIANLLAELPAAGRDIQRTIAKTAEAAGAGVLGAGIGAIVEIDGNPPHSNFRVNVGGREGAGVRQTVAVAYGCGAWRTGAGSGDRVGNLGPEATQAEWRQCRGRLRLDTCRRIRGAISMLEGSSNRSGSV